MRTTKPKVFVVHGHNELARLQLCETLSIEFGLEPVVLAQRPGLGRTVIEQFESHASKCVLAVVLLTGDDISDTRGKKTLRARQNVIFELGYLCSALGRDRICLLYQEGVELPSDLEGVIYYPFSESIKEVQPALRKHIDELGLLDRGSEPAILVVDDDLTLESPLVKQLQTAFSGHAKVELLANPEEATITLTSGRNILGCITDVVFRRFSPIAGIHVAEVALQEHIDVVVFSGHRREDIGVALAELDRIGLARERILPKPTSIREYRRFLGQIRQWFLGVHD